MQKIVFASGNAHKIEEVKSILSGVAEVVSPADLGFFQEIEENGTSFEANALIKANAIYQATGCPCIADDSGLCVEALNEAPGVFSARYAGEPVNHSKNIEKLLEELSGQQNRSAKFVAVLCAVGFSAEPMFARGEVQGEILEFPQGLGGFGYDPVFKAHGMMGSFAECTSEQKNQISHRGRAWQLLLPMLQAKVPDIEVAQYDYPLIEDRIAKFPASPRDSSKLLVFQGGEIQHAQFSELLTFISSDDAGSSENSGDSVLLVTNTTKVIPARLHGHTQAGAAVEIFLLDPISPDWLIWQAMVGGRKKFKEKGLVELRCDRCVVQVTWNNRELDQVRLNVVEGGLSVMEAIEALGKVPLPPYLNREVEPEDKERYQAIFANTPGAVAAPTASLHFTQNLLDELQNRGVQFATALLHVGAGTFKPMSGNTASEHDMHAERFEISVETLRKLKHHRGRIVAVGTTVMRVLESLYCIYRYSLSDSAAMKRALQDGILELTRYGLEDSSGNFCWVSKEMAYRKMVGDIESTPTYFSREQRSEWLQVLIDVAEAHGGKISGKTQIFIVPGFEFALCDGLITNFHQPKSTLLMLVGALVGENWRSIYEEAMSRDYRFLSFGDGSLLWR